MNVKGLDNDYYLTQNDIWVKVSDLTIETSVLELTVYNETTGASLKPFIMSPSPNREFVFNVCIPVRGLMPYPDHMNINSLQKFTLSFKFKKSDNTYEDDHAISITKFFILGGRNKQATKEWYLNPSEELVVGKWINWNGVTLPSFAKRIQGDEIVDFIPNETINIDLTTCNYKIIKFLNSLGGYQYFIFERYEKKTKSKAGKSVRVLNDRLRLDDFKNTKMNTDRSIEFYDETTKEAQIVIEDLVCSPEVLLYDESGDDEHSKWQRLIIENNEAIINNWQETYLNKISFSFSDNVKREI